MKIMSESVYKALMLHISFVFKHLSESEIKLFMLIERKLMSKFQSHLKTRFYTSSLLEKCFSNIRFFRVMKR